MKKGNNSFRHDTHADADAYFELASANKLNKKKHCATIALCLRPLCILSTYNKLE